MIINEIELKQLSPNLWEIPRTGDMNVPGRIYISQKMIERSLQNDQALQQVINVAHLPGIQKYSLAMPDIHWGYGFPIGGVAAFDWRGGGIFPRGGGCELH